MYPISRGEFTHHPLGSSSLFTAISRQEVHPPLNTIPKGQLPINSRRGTHKLVVHKEETTWVGSRGRRAERKRAKVPLVNARWKRYSPCGIRCKAERVRGCGLRSCHVSAREKRNPGASRNAEEPPPRVRERSVDFPEIYSATTVSGAYLTSPVLLFLS